MDEKTIQKQVAKHFRELSDRLGTFTFTAIPGGSVRVPIHIGKQLKDMGCLAGVHDILFFLDEGCTLLIELKTLDGAPSEAQRKFFSIIRKLGHEDAVIYAADGKDAIKQITEKLRNHGVNV